MGTLFQMAEDIAIAQGLRPPVAPFPCLWHSLASVVFAAVGPQIGLLVLKVAGLVSLGLTAALSFVLYRGVLPGRFAAWEGRARWTRWIVRGVPLCGMALFVLSVPVVRMGCVFSPTMLHLLLFLGAVAALARTSRTSRPRDAYVFAALSGVLAAESPLGWLLPPAFAAVVAHMACRSAGEGVPIVNPLVRMVTFRCTVQAFAAAFLLAFGADMAFFLAHDGLSALGLTPSGYAIALLKRPFDIMSSEATPFGWMLMLGAILPMAVVAVACAPSAADEDRFLPLWYGLFFAVAGLSAVLQLSGPAPCRLWALGGVPRIGDGLLLALYQFLCGLVATMAFAVLAAEAFFRSPGNLAAMRFADAVEEARGVEAVGTFRVVRRVVRRVAFALPCAAVALSVSSLYAPAEREMAAVVEDAVRQTAAEAAGSDAIFTDGALDAAIEVAASCAGRRLVAVSMMPDSSPRAAFLRARAGRDEEDRELLSVGAAEALRTWVLDKPERATNLAVQVGLELFESLSPGKGIRHVDVGGLVVRTGALPQGSWTEGAHALAGRILHLYGKCDPDSAGSWVRTPFRFVQWRLARLCERRADAADDRGDISRALGENSLADRLDGCNAAYRRIRERRESVGNAGGMLLTPREGLKLGLARADFRLAEPFARRILASEPENPEANFALGMGHFIAGRYACAEHFLALSAAARPEPAVMNNLAVAQLRQERPYQALTNAIRAVEMFPDIPEIRRTLDQARKAAK